MTCAPAAPWPPLSFTALAPVAPVARCPLPLLLQIMVLWMWVEQFVGVDSAWMKDLQGIEERKARDFTSTHTPAHPRNCLQPFVSGLSGVL